MGKELVMVFKAMQLVGLNIWRRSDGLVKDSRGGIGQV